VTLLDTQNHRLGNSISFFYERGLEGGGVCLPTGGIRRRWPRRKNPEVQEGTVPSAAGFSGMEFKARRHAEEHGLHLEGARECDVQAQ
jgi:hypothetical protein